MSDGLIAWLGLVFLYFVFISVGSLLICGDGDPTLCEASLRYTLFGYANIIAVVGVFIGYPLYLFYNRKKEKKEVKSGEPS